LGKIKCKGFFFLLPAFFVLVFCSVCYGDFDSTYEYYAYGTGDFIAKIFNGLAFFAQSDLMKDIIPFALIAAFLIYFIQFIFPQGKLPDTSDSLASFIRFLIIMAFVQLGFINGTMTANVFVNDVSEPTNNEVVSDVPILPAMIAHYTSFIGHTLGVVVDEYVTDVDAVRFTNSGMIAGGKYLTELLEIEPPGAPSLYNGVGYTSINAAIQNYFERCVFPVFAFIPSSDSVQAQGLQLLESSTDLLNAYNMPPYSDPGLHLTVCISDNDRCNCQLTPSDINSKWNSIFQTWFDEFNKKNNIGDRSKAEEILNRYLVQDSGMNYTDFIRQIAVMNAIRYAFLSYAASSGQSYNYGNEIAEKKVGAGWIQAGRLFEKIVVVMRTICEGLVIIFSAFLPVFFVFAGIKGLTTLVKVMFWLQLWVPIYCVLNAFADSLLQKEIHKILMDHTGYVLPPNFTNIENLRTQIDLVMGYVGAFSWSIPTIAWGLLKGGEYAMSQAAGALASSRGGESIASSVGADYHGTANLSVGNQSLGNRSLMSSSFAGSAAQGAVSATREADVIEGVLRAYRQLKSEGTSEASFYDTLKDTLQKLKEADGLGGPEKAAKLVSSVGAGGMIGKVNAFLAEAEKRGISLLGLSSQYSEFEARTGLAGMEARVGFAHYMVKKGLARDLQDAYVKMAQEGLIPGVARIQAYGGDMESMLGNQATVESAKIGNVDALRKVAKALYGSSDDNAVRKAQEFLDTSRGMNEAAKFSEILDIAKKAGKESDWEAFLAHQRPDIEMSLSSKEASRLLGMPNAPAGSYLITRDDQGRIIAANMKSGFEGVILDQISEHLAIDTNTKEGKATAEAIADSIHGVNPYAEGKLRDAIKRGDSIAVDTRRTRDGKIASFTLSTGGTFTRSDFAENLEGYENITKTLTRVLSGYQEWFGTNITKENVNQTIGTYVGPDGKLYYGNFQYAVDPETNKVVIVSGSGSNVLEFKTKGTFVAPDGTVITGLLSSYYGDSGDTFLKSRIESGFGVDYDSKKRFSSGYEYDNFLSAFLGEYISDRASQAAGKIQGIFVDLSRYFSLSRFISPSSSKKHGK